MALTDWRRPACCWHWLAGWRILTEDYIPMHELAGGRARALKVVRKTAQSLGPRARPQPAILIPLSFIFADFGFEPPYRYLPHTYA